MAQPKETAVTDKNLEKFADFLVSELNNPKLASQIPNNAHIFHGSYNDMAWTLANLKMANTALIGIALGFREEEPLVMLFEYKPDQYTVIDLATAERSNKVQVFANTFQEQNQKDLLIEIDELMAI